MALPGSSLHIHFAQGERPHVFWVSRWERGPRDALRYKVLTKRLQDGGLEVLVLEERISGPRRKLARETIPPAQPAGWLSHWVAELERSLGTRFAEFDLRDVSSREQWRRVARRLGWTLDDETGANT